MLYKPIFPCSYIHNYIGMYVSYMHFRVDVCMYVCMYEYAHTCIDAHTRGYTHFIHTHIDSAHEYMYVCMHVCMYVLCICNSSIRAHSCAHRYMHTSRQTHTHAHTQTSISDELSLSLSLSLFLSLSLSLWSVFEFCRIQYVRSL
jgi:hypothetical protein